MHRNSCVCLVCNNKMNCNKRSDEASKRNAKSRTKTPSAMLQFLTHESQRLPRWDVQRSQMKQPPRHSVKCKKRLFNHFFLFRARSAKQFFSTQMLRVFLPNGPSAFWIESGSLSPGSALAPSARSCEKWTGHDCYK